MTRATILLVEDDLSLGRSAAELLRCFGYGVVWRSTLDGAETCLNTVKPDLVLLDLNLRSEYGTDLRLRQGANGSALPVVIVSAQPADECAAAASRMSAAGVLHKPYESAQLLRVVAETLSGKTGRSGRSDRDMGATRGWR